ncbi:GNAT family N-acetyltransferase [Gillisia sp. Hel_I_29]|uniref:GNAT family N-acetyltransferase n=1 Tax=Gillisia sp. Hel_I_29 TaxID=1249975 RepID=UPI000558BEF4|nr:GNAT family N-acetyltransferase [Gillisia sp. Hel_I_29]
MEIKHFNGDKKGQFEAFSDEEKAGLMTYKWYDDHCITIDHTEVYSSFEGKGVGKKLIVEGVAYARKNDLKIRPSCPFAKKYLERTSDYDDVLY